MRRGSQLLALLLIGCSDQPARKQAFEAEWANVRQDSEIQSLKVQIADLQKQDDFQDNEMSALAESQDALQRQAANSTRIANANSNLSDERWRWVANHVR